MESLMGEMLAFTGKKQCLPCPWEPVQAQLHPEKNSPHSIASGVNSAFRVHLCVVHLKEKWEDKSCVDITKNFWK